MVGAQKKELGMGKLTAKTYNAYFTWNGKRYTITIRANRPFTRLKCRRALRRRIPGRISAVLLVRSRNRDGASSAGMIIAEDVK
jgi:hypothetical protein